jgi:hypothetical protein
VKTPAASSSDPLAIDKIRVGRYLAKRGLTEDILPADFYNEPDYDVRRRKLHQIIEAVEAERRAKTAVVASNEPAWLEYVNSRPTVHDWLPSRREFDHMMRTRRWRAKKPAKFIERTARGIPSERVSRSWRDDKLARLKAFSQGTGPLARQLRGREIEMVKAAALFFTLSAELGHQPSHSELAGRIGCTRRAARNRVGILVRLYDGPWHLEASPGVPPSKTSPGVPPSASPGVPPCESI